MAYATPEKISNGFFTVRNKRDKGISINPRLLTKEYKVESTNMNKSKKKRHRV